MKYGYKNKVSSWEDAGYYKSWTNLLTAKTIVHTECNNSMKFMGRTYEPRCDKTNKMICAPSEDSDQPGHPPGQIGVFPVRLMDS